MTVVLITGCSSGIGMASAVEFARHGNTVVATMRDLARSEPLRAALGAAGLEADIRTLDVSNDRSVAVAVESIVADYGDADVIVSNAGIGIEGTTEELAIDDFRVSFETNTLGSVRLLHAVMPSWRERGSGRFIAVSSMAGAMGHPFNDAYCMSKFALEGMLESLNPVAAQFGIRISVIEPGPVAGDFATKHGVPDKRADGPYLAAREKFAVIQDGGFANAQSNEEVAEMIVDIAVADEPMFRYQTSEMVTKVIGLKLNDMSGERVAKMTARWIQ
jgi:NAD(P)-dependent dehydrogenase (short-subunit alcohol dehydrogenase family)